MNLILRLTLSIFLLACPSLMAQAFKYTITDLGPLSERTAQSAAWQVNDNGVVAATMPAQDPYVHGARWNPIQGFEDLSPTSTNSNSVGRSVNFTGDVAGWIVDANGVDQAAVWRSQQGLTLLTLPDSRSSHAKAINDSGQVVGDYLTAAGTRAFLWDPIAGMIDLGLLPKSTDCFATAINQYQDVVGYCLLSGDIFPYKAFIWDRQAGMRFVLPRFSGTTVAFGINNLRKVVGYAQDKTSISAFTSDLGSGRTQYFALATTSKSTTKYGFAFGINDAGQAVGESNSRAFLYDKGKLFDLNTLAPVGSGWVLITAYHLNARGQIVGIGNLDGRRHGFLLSPIQ